MKKETNYKKCDDWLDNLCDGGVDCWKNAEPTKEQCERCDCYYCIKNKCHKE